ncbi:hypothetical protein ACQPZZ_17000 [Microbispora sp. CA-135349]|uniref:hypothetical protein n=1 Tax=Microbispora sp. CA-135349 TaxID=3239953 RepID=UPI003D949655
MDGVLPWPPEFADRYRGARYRNGSSPGNRGPGAPNGTAVASRRAARRGDRIPYG